MHVWDHRMAVFDIIPTHPVLLLIVRYLITFNYFPCSIATTYVPGFSAKKTTHRFHAIYTYPIVGITNAIVFVFY